MLSLIPSLGIKNCSKHCFRLSLISVRNESPNVAFSDNVSYSLLLFAIGSKSEEAWMKGGGAKTASGLTNAHQKINEDYFNL